MKNFSSLEEADFWCRKVLEAGASDGVEVITEDLYKHSKSYTYYDTGQTYGDKGSATLDFKHGLVIQKSDQVRRLYYEGGHPRSKSPPAAGPRWWEVTKRMHAKDMITQAKKVLEAAKKK